MALRLDSRRLWLVSVTALTRVRLSPGQPATRPKRLTSLCRLWALQQNPGGDEPDRAAFAVRATARNLGAGPGL